MDVSNTADATFMSKIQQHARLRLRAGEDGTALTARTRTRLAGHAAVSAIGQREAGEEVARPAPSGETLQRAVREAIEYQRAERGVLKLRTQEGDVVRLKFLNRDSVSAKGEVMDDGERVFGEYSLDAASSSRFKIAVKGDLNAEEQKAIEDVLAQAGALAQSFFDGDVQEAFAMASQFQIDSDQLARVNLRFSVHERFALAREAVSAQTPAVAAAPAPALTGEPSVVAGSPKDPVQVQSVDPAATVSAPALTAPAIEPAAPAAVEPPALAQVAPATDTQEVTPQTGDAFDAAVNGLAGALQQITSFLTQLTESLEAMTANTGDDVNTLSMSFSYGFKLQIVSSFIEHAQEPGDGDQADEDGAAIDLAAQTVDELAAQHDARLDDVA